MGLLHVPKSRHVDAVRPTAERVLIFHARHRPPRPGAEAMVHDVLAQRPAGVGQAVGPVLALRVEENPGRFERGGTEKYQTGAVLGRLHRDGVDDPNPARSSGGGVVEDAFHHAVGPERHPTSLSGGGQGGSQAAEIGMGDTAPLAGPAIVAGGPAVVVLGQDRGPPDGEDPIPPPFLLGGFPDLDLGTLELHRGQELAVRQLRQALGQTGDPDEPFDVRIPGRDVGIPNRPVDAVAVAGIGFEIEIAPPVDLPPPGDRPAPYVALPDPVERLLLVEGVGVLEVVDEELGAPFVTGVAILLDRLLAGHGGRVAVAAERLLPGLDVLGVVAARLDRPARLEHQGRETRSVSSLAAQPPVMPEPTTIASNHADCPRAI